MSKYISGRHVLVANDLLSSLKKWTLPRITKRSDCIESRFAGFIVSDVITWMKIADFANWPKKDLYVYGCSEVQKLTDYFKSVLDANGCVVDDIMDEWHGLKHDVRLNHKMKCHELWESVISEPERYSNILYIVRIILTVIISISHVKCQTQSLVSNTT